jgi:hypothetical protein
MSNVLGDATKAVGIDLGNDFSNAAFLPSVGTAIQQWNQAGQYQDLGNRAADRADPFGQYRRGYGDQLQHLYEDPSAIENTPGYKFALNQSLGATESRLRAMGLTGSSQMQKALVDQASGMAAQTWNQEANRLAQLAGSQFDPARAAAMQMEGGRLKMQAQSNALGSLMYPFGPGAGGGGGQNGGSGSPSRSALPTTGGGGPASWFQRAAQSSGPGGIIQGGGTAMNLFNKWLTSPDEMTEADIRMLENMGVDTGIDLGGSDYAPAGYDPTGFGGWGDAQYDPTLQGIGYDDPNFSVTNYDDIMGDTGSDYGFNYMPDDVDMTGFQVDPWG